jgi:hypothetical protein
MRRNKVRFRGFKGVPLRDRESVREIPYATMRFDDNDNRQSIEKDDISSTAAVLVKLFPICTGLFLRLRQGNTESYAAIKILSSIEHNASKLIASMEHDAGMDAEMNTEPANVMNIIVACRNRSRDLKAIASNPRSACLLIRRYDETETEELFMRANDALKGTVIRRRPKA